MSVNDCQIIDLPKIQDQRGHLTFIESYNHIPFEIKRVYYLYDMPAGSERGSHAHNALEQLVIAISGSFDVVLDDGKKKKRIHLERPYYGLHIVPMMWRTLENFSSGTVCMVLASEAYDESDYIRSYDTFQGMIRGE